jgi:Putative peptidoglycan binding domain/CHAP domain
VATPDDVIAVERAELGYAERPTNRTKFGEWYGLDGNPWCDMFQSWALSQAGIPTHQAYTPAHAQSFIDQGRWDNDPERGDLVFFNWFGERIDHVEIVTQVEADVIHTIGGNTSSGDGGSQNNGGGVYRRIRRRDHTIAGYGRPAYDGTPGPNKRPKTAVRTILRKGDEGPDVMTLQRQLNVLTREDRDVEEDGEFGSETEARVRRFQTHNGLEVDGEVGTNTFSKLNELVRQHRKAVQSGA